MPVVPGKEMDTAKLVETPKLQNGVRDTDNGAAIHLHQCRHQLDRYQFSEHFASVRIVSSSLSPPAHLHSAVGFSTTYDLWSACKADLQILMLFVSP